MMMMMMVMVMNVAVVMTDADDAGDGHDDGGDDGVDEDGDDEHAGGGSLKAECVGDRAYCTSGLHDDSDEHDSVKDDDGEADGKNTVGDAATMVLDVTMTRLKLKWLG